MLPAALVLVIQFVQIAIQEEPAIAASLQQLFASGNPTPQDFSNMIASIQSESYKTFVPNTDFPPSVTG